MNWVAFVGINGQKLIVKHYVEGCLYNMHNMKYIPYPCPRRLHVHSAVDGCHRSFKQAR
jgi:nitric oxide reductase large subunit